VTGRYFYWPLGEGAAEADSEADGEAAAGADPGADADDEGSTEPDAGTLGSGRTSTNAPITARIQGFARRSSRDGSEPR